MLTCTSWPADKILLQFWRGSPNSQGECITLLPQKVHNLCVSPLPFGYTYQHQCWDSKYSQIWIHLNQKPWVDRFYSNIAGVTLEPHVFCGKSFCFPTPESSSTPYHLPLLRLTAQIDLSTKNRRWCFYCYSCFFHFVLGGGFRYFFIFTPIVGEIIQFDLRMFYQMGWWVDSGRFHHEFKSLPLPSCKLR